MTFVADIISQFTGDMVFLLQIVHAPFLASDEESVKWLCRTASHLILSLYSSSILTHVQGLLICNSHNNCILQSGQPSSHTFS